VSPVLLLDRVPVVLFPIPAVLLPCFEKVEVRGLFGGRFRVKELSVLAFGVWRGEWAVVSSK
jgi:hypothetical protein